MLTVKKIAKCTEPGRYHDANGLYLGIGRTGARSWLLRFQKNGRERWMGLGPTHAFSLDEARGRARAARQLLADGVDPIEAKRAEQTRQTLEAAKNKTFADVALEYFAAHEHTWTNRKHRAQFTSTLRDYASSLNNLPVSAIDEPMILAVLRPIWGTKNPTARKLRHKIAAVLDFATAAKYRKGDNPAKWEDHLEHLLADPEKIKPVVHHPALPFTEISKFMAELRKVDGIAARALEFTVLTAARAGEARGATWNEIDLKTKTWTIPAERMKMSKEHRVPLCNRAIEILTALPHEGDAVFIGARAGGAMGVNAMFLVAKGLRPDVTVHGFRSTFSTWAHETTAFAGAVIELSLAHTVGNAVERAYRRGDLFDQRRQLMTAWADYCDRPQQQGADNITPIRKGRR
jgi:integrase